MPEIMAWGCGALILRKAARRRRRGWIGTVLRRHSCRHDRSEATLAFTSSSTKAEAPAIATA
jgi:hypothetical protein